MASPLASPLASPDQPYRPPLSEPPPPKVQELRPRLYPFELRVRLLGCCQLLLGAGAAVFLWPELIAKFYAYFLDPVVAPLPLDIHRDNWIYVVVSVLLLVSGFKLATLVPKSRLLGLTASAMALCFPPFGIVVMFSGLHVFSVPEGRAVCTEAYRVVRRHTPRPSLEPSVGLVARLVMWSFWLLGGFWFLAKLAGWI